MEFQIVETTDPVLPFFWRIVDGDGRMLTFSSHRYRSKEECADAVDAVRRGAAGAAIVDMTTTPS
jgi:uncharacterized protein YegP (UPF0339 family)